MKRRARERAGGTENCPSHRRIAAWRAELRGTNQNDPISPRTTCEPRERAAGGENCEAPARIVSFSRKLPAVPENYERSPRITNGARELRSEEEGYDLRAQTKSERESCHRGRTTTMGAPDSASGTQELGWIRPTCHRSARTTREPGRRRATHAIHEPRRRTRNVAGDRRTDLVNYKPRERTTR
jgi:hypothetical protein